MHLTMVLKFFISLHKSVDMHNTTEKLQEAVELSKKMGVEEAAEKLRIQVDTLIRYEKELKRRGLFDSKPERRPNILVFDVENSFTAAALWRIYKVGYIPKEHVLDEWYMLSWAAKWLYASEDTLMSDVVTPEESLANDDTRLMKSLWELFDIADIVIGHNIIKFDVRKANTRFVTSGLMPPSTYQMIDTLSHARNNFSFSRNDLDYLCMQFGLGERKADNGGMARWIACTRGDAEALKEMEKYNRQDIKASEELYIAMRPWMKSHPNLGLYMDAEADMCYKCGSVDLEWLKTADGRDKLFRTTVNAYPEYRCNSCKSIGRSRFSAYERGGRKHITSKIPQISVG